MVTGFATQRGTGRASGGPAGVRFRLEPRAYVGPCDGSFSVI